MSSALLTSSLKPIAQPCQSNVAALLKAYDPNEPRDEKGQWTSSGGGPAVGMFHGTPEELVESIRSTGLGGKEGPRFSFLSSEKKDAVLYAAKALFNRYGEEWTKHEYAVVVVKPGYDKYMAHPIYEEWKTAEHIPPEYIDRVEIYKGKNTDSPVRVIKQQGETQLYAGVLLASVQKSLDSAAHAASTSPLNLRPVPTAAQIQAGNYPKGHVKLAGLDITVENPAGSTRKGSTLQAHYGYVKGTEGADGDHVDVFIRVGTPKDWQGTAFVIDQYISGEFDEHKVMLGYDTAAQARQDYANSYSPKWGGLGAITPMTMGELKAWLKQPAVEAVEKVEWDESQHPRDEQGKFSFGGDTGHPDDSKVRTGGYSKPSTVRLGQRSEDMLNDAQANWFDNASDAQKDSTFSTKEISLGDLKTVQYGVREGKVSRMMNNFDPNKQKELPWVDVIDGVPVISDGNHRVEAAVRSGVKSLVFNVRDLSGFKRDGYRLLPPPVNKLHKEWAASASPTSGITAYGMIRRKKRSKTKLTLRSKS